MLWTIAIALLALFFTLLIQAGSISGGAFNDLALPAPTPHPTFVTFPPTETQTEQRSEPLVVINGEALHDHQLQAILIMDQTLAHFLGGLPTANRGIVLEQLINRTLILQQAKALGIQTSGAAAATRLDHLLAERGATNADLQAALSAVGIAEQTFLAYFAQLLTVEATAGQLSLSQLQQDARISYSPAAAALLQPVAEVEPITETLPPLTPVAPLPIGAAPGNLAPAFSLALLSPAEDEAERVSMDDLRGRPTVLSFWTSWCPYCQRQTPLLVEAYHRYVDEGVQFIGVNVKEESAVVMPYVQTHQISYPIGMDRSGQIASDYLVRGFPTTYFLDAAGVVVARHVGQLQPEQIEGYIADLFVNFSLEAPQ
jgi:thiol-disulfide isomerase/thioredoxin